MQSKRKKGSYDVPAEQNADAIELRSNVNDDDANNAASKTPIDDTDVTDDDNNTAASAAPIDDDDADVTDVLLSGQRLEVAKPNSPNTTNVDAAAVSNVKLRQVSRTVTKQRHPGSDDSEPDALNVRQRVDYMETKTRELWPEFDESAESCDGAVADQLMPMRLTTKY